MDIVATGADVRRQVLDVNLTAPALLTKAVLPSTIENRSALAVFLASDTNSAITGTAIDSFGGSNPLFG